MANVGFYFFGNVAPNRGLAFGKSRMGPADAFSWLALGPAYVFDELTVYALARIGWHALMGSPEAVMQANGKARR